MKKTILVFALLIATKFANSQNGLEGIIVENYYESDSADSIASDDAGAGLLPVGSKTYRIYVDMLPGYKFQAVYGIDNPVHEFRISTSGLCFYNNEDRGASTSDQIGDSHLDENTVMLDSWFSVGGASDSRSGLMKVQDDGVANIVNVNNALQNSNTWIGTPLTTEDGISAVTPNPVTLVGISNEILVFGDSNTPGDSVFSTINGSLACLTGSYGPDTIDNKVLVAQITTNGCLFFKLNIQIGTPTGGVENYVAENPVGNEIQIQSLTYYSCTVGVNEIKSTSSSFRILSNPSTDFVTMEIHPDKEINKSSYAIYDITGRVFYSKELGKISDSRSETIDISSLAKGQYLLELTLDGISSAKKIVKE